MKESVQNTSAAVSLVMMGSILIITFFVIRSIFSFSFLSLKVRNKLNKIPLR